MRPTKVLIALALALLLGAIAVVQAQPQDYPNCFTVVVTSKVTNGPLVPGAQAVYTLDWGTFFQPPCAWEDGILTDTAPPELTFVACSQECEHDGQVITWVLGTQSSGTRFVTFTVAFPLTDGHSIVNHMALSATALLLGPFRQDYRSVHTASSAHTLAVSIVPAGDFTRTIGIQALGTEPSVAAMATVSVSGGRIVGSIPPPNREEGGAAVYVLGDLMPPMSLITRSETAITIGVRPDSTRCGDPSAVLSVLVTDATAQASADHLFGNCVLYLPVVSRGGK